MEVFWTSAIAVLLLANVVFLIVVLGLAREVGVLIVRLGPTYARPMPVSPSVGGRVDNLDLIDLHGNSLTIYPVKFGSRLLVFVSPRCSLCSDLIPGIRALSQTYRADVEVYAVSSGDHTPEDYDYAKKLGSRVHYVCRGELHTEFGIDGTPFAMLIDSDNRLVSRGIVNSLEHLESLFKIRQLTMAKRASTNGELGGNTAALSIRGE